MTSTRAVVLAALAGDLLVALSKSGAAWWTGSSAMTSEAVHSFVEIGNDLLLLYGMRRSQRPADAQHPVGYGRELYFWSFIVALLVLSLGAGVAVMQGIEHVRHPAPIEDPAVNYVVIALSLLFEGASFWIALRQYRQVRRAVSFLQAVRTSKNPPALMVLIGGGAAILGLAFVAAATWASARLGWHAADGWASIAIGLVLAAMSGFVANESKSLLIGEQADERLRQSIAQLASAEAGVVRAAVRFTVQLAPDQVAAALAIQFAPDLKAGQIETAAARIEQAIARAHPQVVSVMLTPRPVSPAPGRRVGNEPITHCER